MELVIVVMNPTQCYIHFIEMTIQGVFNLGHHCLWQISLWDITMG